LLRLRLHVRTRDASTPEPLTLEQAVITPEQPTKFINHVGDRIVIVIAILDASSCLLQRQGDGFVVAFGELGSGK
jgi:hypothetical protein